MALSPAHLLLGAAQFATEADIESLRKLISGHSSLFPSELVLRILLTFLSESTEPATYSGLVRDLVADNLSNLDDFETPSFHDALLEEEAAGSRARSIRLLSLGDQPGQELAAPDVLLARFILARSRRIDAETGALLLVQQLIDEFDSHSSAVNLWAGTKVLPLLRLEYEFFEAGDKSYSLSEFEKLENGPGLDSLVSKLLSLEKEQSNENIGRDFRCIICPWIYGACAVEAGVSEKKPPSYLWSRLYQSIYSIACEDASTAASILLQWHGPSDIDLGDYVEASGLRTDLIASNKFHSSLAMAVIYLPKENFSIAWDTCAELLDKAAVSSGLEGPFNFRLSDVASQSFELEKSFLASISSNHLNLDNLLSATNSLLNPTSESITFAALILASSYLLNSLGEELAPVAALNLCLHGFEADQRTLLRKLLGRLSTGPTKDDEFWRQTRQKILWLNNWSLSYSKAQLGNGVFGKLFYVECELELLKALAVAARFDVIQHVYVEGQKLDQVTSQEIEDTILDAAFTFYDNASNGNKTRGGIKRASDIVSTFKPLFPHSFRLKQLQALIQATHSLSFYSLTLQHGVPLLPVNVRVHADPLSLITKVLAQNSKSYTKLEDLLEIGSNMVKAGLINVAQDVSETVATAEERVIAAVRRQITAQAIEAALQEDDFDTAYSYITSRLSPSNHESLTESLHSTPTDDNLLWQAAYHAGRYVPSKSTSASDLRRLEQRMELLSQALLLAPPSALREILLVWQEREREANALSSKEREEEDRWDAKGDRYLPGGFTRDDIVPTPHKPRNATQRAMEEETPMGLFEVARGAASAFSKSAFPLRAQSIRPTRASRDATGSPTSSREDYEGNESGDRLRKRDMVSSMVTGGLKSGIGWVIGARSSDMQQ